MTPVVFMSVEWVFAMGMLSGAILELIIILAIAIRR